MLPSVMVSLPFLRILCLVNLMAFLQLGRLDTNMVLSETFGASEFGLKHACGLNGRKGTLLDVCTKSS